MEKLLQFVDFADQRRLGQVSKSWRSVVSQSLMLGARRQLPWLILPEAPNHRTNNYLSFLTFPGNNHSKGKVVKLKLPKQLRGGWIYGSCKGWLIIIKENGLNSEMCLLNPISGVLYKLPPLITVPSFEQYVKTREWKLLGANGFCRLVTMSTPEDYNSSSNITVAAVFHDRKTLCLCRPGDEKWTFFPVKDVLLDILFSSGILYALVWSEEKDSSVEPTCLLKFAQDDVVPLKLKLVYDKQQNTNRIIDDNHGNFKIVRNARYGLKLLESTTKEVLIVHQVFDYVLETENDEGGGGDDDSDDEDIIDESTKNVRLRTSWFWIYKIDECTNKFHIIQSLSDQLLFCGDDGAFSIPASNIKEIENNCIYFTTNIYREADLESGATNVFEGFGVFYLDDQRIERLYQDMEASVKYQGSWFTPSF